MTIACFKGRRGAGKACKTVKCTKLNLSKANFSSVRQDSAFLLLHLILMGAFYAKWHKYLIPEYEMSVWASCSSKKRESLEFSLMVPISTFEEKTSLENVWPHVKVSHRSKEDAQAHTCQMTLSWGDVSEDDLWALQVGSFGWQTLKKQTQLQPDGVCRVPTCSRRKDPERSVFQGCILEKIWIFLLTQEA